MVEKDKFAFFKDKVLNADDQEEVSDDVECMKFREFLLHVHLREEGTPSNSTVQIKVQFFNEAKGIWTDYMNGPFGFMLWEEDAIATGDQGLNVSTSGRCVGRRMRVVLVADKPSGATLDASNYFKATIGAEFMD